MTAKITVEIDGAALDPRLRGDDELFSVSLTNAWRTARAILISCNVQVLVA